MLSSGHAMKCDILTTNNVAEDLVFWDMVCQVSCTIHSAVTCHMSDNMNL
jgi:hypothetical protein